MATDLIPSSFSLSLSIFQYKKYHSNSTSAHRSYLQDNSLGNGYLFCSNDFHWEFMPILYAVIERNSL